MIAFDTDVLTEILMGNAACVGRAATIPVHEQAVPVIVIEEIMRGRRVQKADGYNYLIVR
jgi:predicted nucleic acid-binding protein